MNPTEQVSNAMIESPLDRQLLAGNAESLFESAFERFRPRGYAIAAHILGDQDEAHDILQEAYLRAKSGITSLRQETKLDAWLLRIVVNLSLKQLRRQKMRRYVSVFLATPMPSRTIDLQAAASEEVQRLRTKLDTLSPKQRTVFTLRFLHEMSLDEIAQATGLSLPTLKTHLLRATKQLRKCMNGG